MHDVDVRIAVRNRLEAIHCGHSDTLLVDELGLRGQVRVDIAVINGSLSGFELKSASDNLRRLPVQARVYSEVLDFSTLVVAENHFAHSLEIVPEWWGIIVAHWENKQVVLKEERHALRNPRVDILAMVELLWRDEALQLLELHGKANGYRSKSRAILWKRLTETLDSEILADHIREIIRARKDWRSAR